MHPLAQGRVTRESPIERRDGRVERLDRRAHAAWVAAETIDERLVALRRDADGGNADLPSSQTSSRSGLTRRAGDHHCLAPKNWLSQKSASMNDVMNNGRSNIWSSRPALGKLSVRVAGMFVR